MANTPVLTKPLPVPDSPRENAEPDQKTGKFRPMDTVNALMSDHRIIHVASEFRRYDMGCYRSWDGHDLRREIVGRLGDTVRTCQVDEIVRLLEIKAHQKDAALNPPHILNLANGLFNVETLTLTEHSPDVLSTVQSRVTYDASAECLWWHLTLDRILPDPEDQQLLSEIFGYCLTPDVSLHKAFLFYGEGANGKSVVLDVLAALVGNDHCTYLGLSSICGQDSRFRLDALASSLVNISSDTSTRPFQDLESFKRIVSGEPIIGERKHQQPYTLRPLCKMIFALNKLPRSHDDSKGFFRRLVILPFQQTIPEDDPERDPVRAEYIVNNELSGLFNWALGGLKALRAAGRFTISPASRAAMSNYQEAVRPALTFVRQSVVRADACCEVSLKDIYSRFKDWALDTGNPIVSDRALRELIEREFGLTKAKGRGGIVFHGLRLTEDP